MFNKMWHILFLWFLSANAQNNTDAKKPETADSDTVKVEPKSISSLYIGDLLRTKPGEDLEAAGSLHQPAFLYSVRDQHSSRKTHGGHDYPEAEFNIGAPSGRSTAAKSVGTEARGFPVMGHILTLKPVRVVPADTLPTSRSSEKPAAHYPHDDCSKSTDHSYSSEESPPAHDQPTYRRAQQVDPSAEPEYRSPQGGYSDEDRYSGHTSHSNPSSGTYRSKSHASDTSSKTQSSGSFSKSVSKSSSRTVSPKSKKGVQLVPAEIGPGLGDKKVLVYKVKDHPSQRPEHPEQSERDYPPSNYGREHNPPSPPEPHYHQQTTGVRKSRKPSYERPNHGSSSVPKRHQLYEPAQYEPEDKPPHYEQDEGSDDRNAYGHGGDQRYEEQGKPANNYHDSQYSHRPDTREPGYKSHSQSYTTSEGETPYGPQSDRKHHNPSQSYYERPSNDAPAKPSEYRPQEYSNAEHSYAPEHKTQSPRDRKEIPQSSYQSHPYHDDRIEPPQSYERSRPVHRPLVEKQEYTYEATPQQTTVKHGNRAPVTRPHRESSRYARSPGRRGHPVTPVEGQNSPAARNGPLVLETKPYVSRSVSFSGNPHAARQEILPNEGRQTGTAEHQTVYKPYNSEHPASYADDQHHQNTAAQHTSRAYQRPYDRTQSYSSNSRPSHSQTHSQSSGGRGRPQPYQDEGYDQDDDEESSYEQDSGPPKKNKDHHYISKISGFKDTYGRDEPLNIDEDFFKKYGISPTAKVIVASAKKPNVFVADGTNVKEGDYFNSGLSHELSSGHNSGPSSGSEYGHGSGPSSGSEYGHGSGPSSGSEYGHGLGPSSGSEYGHGSRPYKQGPSGPGYGPSSEEEDSYEPSYKRDTSTEELEPIKQIPGSFDDLVDTNPKFLRNLPEMLKGGDVFFDSSEISLDGVEVPKVGEQRGYIVSQGPREIVQQHGDGVSRILYNIPRNLPEARNAPEAYSKQNQEKIIEAASKIIENIIKTDS